MIRRLTPKLNIWIKVEEFAELPLDENPCSDSSDRSGHWFIADRNQSLLLSTPDLYY